MKYISLMLLTVCSLAISNVAMGFQVNLIIENKTKSEIISCDRYEPESRLSTDHKPEGPMRAIPAGGAATEIVTSDAKFPPANESWINFRYHCYEKSTGNKIVTIHVNATPYIVWGSGRVGKVLSADSSEQVSSDSAKLVGSSYYYASIEDNSGKYSVTPAQKGGSSAFNYLGDDRWGARVTITSSE